MPRYTEISAARIFHGTLLAGVGLALLFAGEDLLTSFLSERVLWRTSAGAVALTLLGVALVVRELAGRRGSIQRNRANAPGSTGSDPGPLWALLLPMVLIPAALASSSAALAQNRVYAPPGDPGENVPEITYRLFPEPGPEGVIDIDAASFATLPYLTLQDPAFADGLRVRVVGFVHRKPHWPEGLFLLSRLAVWCCAADARLTGMLVHLDEPLPPNGRWLRVEGRVGTAHDIDLGGRVLSVAPILRDITYRLTEPPQEQFVPAAGW